MSEFGIPVRLRLALLPGLILAALVALCVTAEAAAAEAASACATPIGRIVSIQGAVEVQRAGQQTWSPIKRLDAALCQGDIIRTGPASRAALVILPEKFIRVDQRSMLSISVNDEETVVELSQGGAGYFITRFPRKFKVNTRFLNAAVEGTEFMVAMGDEAAAVSVFEGRVSAESPGSSERVLLKSGETASAGAGQAPVTKLTVRPLDAVQWVLYYPPLGAAAPDANPDQSCEPADASEKSKCLTTRAEQRLRSGRVDDAQADIEASLVLAPDNSDASALLSIIAVVKNDKTRALTLARRATQIDPTSPRAWIALSYAQQASFSLEDALASAERAATLAPRDSTAQSRVAELLMSLGRTSAAEHAALTAVEANPDDSRAHAILGFVHLAQIRTDQARGDFEAAAERDSSDPLPRLGLGLALIRGGELKGGREQIEIAVALDPANSLIRSYMGKAYYDERSTPRDALARSQLELAKQLDPKDPTPWFYDALIEQTTNRPGIALENIQRSVELNDERQVYRSRLLLDQDVAARSANQADIYKDLGFEQLSRNEALTSVGIDPSSFSGHRFLADSYGPLPRLGGARVSELLQSQLLQPANGNPVPPQLAESDLLIVQGTGPTSASLQEFNPLFNRDRVDGYLSGVVGSNDTHGGEATASLLHGGTALSAGYFTYRTDGFRPNNDYSQNIGDLMIQQDVSNELGLQAELRTSHVEHGDLRMNFDLNDFSSNFRQDVDTYTGRLGARYSPDVSSTIVGSFIFQRRNDRQDTSDDSTPPFLLQQNFYTEVSSMNSELQYLYRGSWIKLTAGAGHYETHFDDRQSVSTLFFGGAPVFQSPPGATWNVQDTTGYLYSTISVLPQLAVVLGASADSYRDGSQSAVDTDQINPKAGVIAQPFPGTTLRAAWFRYLKRQQANDQTIEPTQVAGFNQIYDDVNGTDSKSAGVGIDQRFGPRVSAGAELLSRSLTVPGVDTVTGSVRKFDWNESLGRAYVSWLATPRVAFGAEYYYDLERRDIIAPTFPRRIETQYFPFTASYHDPSGWFVKLKPVYVNQDLQVGNFAGGVDHERDDFWLINAILGYRLPGRYGLVTLEGQNLGDRDFHFQDIDPVGDPRPPLFQPGRTVYLKFTLAF